MSRLSEMKSEEQANIKGGAAISINVHFNIGNERINFSKTQDREAG